VSEKFGNLFKPYKFRTFEVSNRVVMPPMAIYIPSSNGYVKQRLIDYYEARAKGKPGLIIVNATYVSPISGASHPNQTALFDDSHIEGLRKLVDVIHSYGVKTIIQLYHSGRQRFGMIAGGETLSPSGIPDPVRKDPTRAITIPEIQKLTKEFAAAALRAKKAGFEGIELHCGHGYLLSGFLSPYQNTRSDEYGGDVWNRTRIVGEIIASCREAIGDDMLIGVRMNGSDYVNGGNTLEDSKEIAKILVDAGAELIHVTAGMAPSAHYTFLPAEMAPGCNVYLAEGIKEAVGPDVPVIAVGAIEDPVQAEKILRENDIDFVAIGRPMFADPEIVKKAKEGRLKEIRPCLRCSKSAGVWPEDMRCTVNPAVGMEKVFEKNLSNIGPSKKVLVIGSGPAGLEAARIAAIKGHDVTIMDRKDKIGGKMLLAKLRPGKDRLIDRWIAYYENEIERLNIKVELGKEVTVEMVEAFQPDITLVATGGKPLVPGAIKGADNKKVVVADDVLLDKVPVGQNVAIIGGSSLGVETADFILQDDSRKVTVFEMQRDVLMDISGDAELALLEDFLKKDIKFLTSTDVLKVVENKDKFDLQIRRYSQPDVITGFDTVVLACGVIPENQLGLALQKKMDNVLLIGDSETPGDFRKAVHDAAKACMKL